MKGRHGAAQHMVPWQTASLDVRDLGFNIWRHEVRNVSTMNM